jgi:hypothetical protein
VAREGQAWCHGGLHAECEALKKEGHRKPWSCHAEAMMHCGDGFDWGSMLCGGDASRRGNPFRAARTKHGERLNPGEQSSIGPFQQHNTKRDLHWQLAKNRRVSLQDGTKCDGDICSCRKERRRLPPWGTAFPKEPFQASDKSSWVTYLRVQLPLTTLCLVRIG